ncbi:MAG TPA: RidA family protein [Syntrophomonadaceae bacterium]|nr:RidA family protein [Syntrophomonadaceae bacterium]HQE24084.1 RidA family protein [Syntrophomonadaceae bacterium]
MVDNKLEQLGAKLPEIPTALGLYLPAQRSGQFLFVSGQLPIEDGQVAYPGKLGRELSIEQGQQAARLAALRCLAVVRSCINDWDEVNKIVRLTGYIQSDDDFHDQPLVINAASELLEYLFGAGGKHARIAVGVNALPMNACCEIEMIVELK